MTRMRYAHLGGRMTTVAGIALLAGSMTLASGCQMPRSDRDMRAAAAPVERDQVDFWVESSMEEVLVGEVVTITARDRNTAGRQPQIEWTTTGGQLTTERNNRIARIQFDTPGVFTITGRMYAEDVVISDSIDVRVRPLR